MYMRMHLAVVGGLLALAAPLCADVTAELSPLSPACQIETDGDAIRVFAEMEAWGEEPPRWLGTVVDGRVRVLPRDSAAVVPEEPWAVVWFGSAPFLPHFDVPWLVVFPDRVHALSLDGHGLRVDFRGAGRVRMMPLMGAAKLLRDRGAPHPWAEGLPIEVADQARELTRVLLARPVAMTETATADPGTDALTLHYRVTAWDDECDYDMEPRRIIPLPSVLLHALQTGFPGAVHGGQLRDLGVFTPYGPWGGVEANDECELVFPLLEYVHQAERPVSVDRLADGPAAEALARLRDVLSASSSTARRMRSGTTAAPTTFAGK
ncbi:MAG: hypothetical protein GF320_03440 [Armatimonadia bacterium]|nr:hypothetical protein [Armatimonadia bacterium]